MAVAQLVHDPLKVCHLHAAVFAHVCLTGETSTIVRNYFMRMFSIISISECLLIKKIVFWLHNCVVMAWLTRQTLSTSFTRNNHNLVLHDQFHSLSDSHNVPAAQRVEHGACNARIIGLIPREHMITCLVSRFE